MAALQQKLLDLASQAATHLADARLVAHQGPMLRTLARTMAIAVGQRLGRRASTELPGPEIVQTVPARPPELIQRYLAHLDSTADWGAALPNHLFPQWTFPTLARTLERIPYPLNDLLNGGAKLISHRPLPANESLTTRARLERIDDDERRAVMHQRLVTGTPSAPDALEVEFRAVVRKRGGGRDGKRADKPTVPDGVQEIGRWALSPRSGLEFALLTGDLNPIHWIPLAARAAGFRNTILHGFASMSRAAEALVAGRDPQDLAMLDVRFVQPLVLPRHANGEAGVRSIACFVRDQEVYVGTEIGGPAFMVGTYALR